MNDIEIKIESINQKAIDLLKEVLKSDISTQSKIESVKHIVDRAINLANSKRELTLRELFTLS